jgi:hypothetical protein
VWIHTDLLRPNLLAYRGRLCAVIASGATIVLVLTSLFVLALCFAPIRGSRRRNPSGQTALETTSR